LDGWGCAPPGPGNAVELADTPVFDRLWRGYPHTTLEASGEAVGLPPGQMGNSEVGHLTIGSGRILDQDLQRVNRAVASGAIFENEALVGAFRRARERGGEVHLLGLVSYGGVHSHIDHLRALLELARREEMEADTYIDVFTDGRDVSPTSAVRDVAELPSDRIATICGRYYAMDRDQRRDRTDLAVAAVVEGRGVEAEDPVEAIRASYEAGITDEFIVPVVLRGRPHLDVERDSAIAFNFRPDRMRQLVMRLLDRGADTTTMTRYSEDFDCPVAFAEQQVDETMAQVLAEHGARQLHVAETEKYAHVTYFFNGGHEHEWPGETRVLIPSPRDVPSYDLKPEMSAREVTRRFDEEIGSGLSLRGRQLREPGHGRAHRCDSRGGEGCGNHGRMPRGRRERSSARRRRLADHGRPWECGANAGAGRRQPAHGAYDESRPVDRHGYRGVPFGARRALGSDPNRPRSFGARQTLTDDRQKPDPEF